MTKNITFSAEERLIENARAKARSEHRTLNEAFRDWLTKYSDQEKKVGLEDIRKRWRHIKVGGPYSREDMNERR